MSEKENWNGGLRRPGSGDGVLRHPDRSIDIAAYAAIAHRQRTAALVSSMLLAVQFLREAWSAISAPAVLREKSVAGKDCAHTR